MQEIYRNCDTMPCSNGMSEVSAGTHDLNRFELYRKNKKAPQGAFPIMCRERNRLLHPGGS